jgi:hypothetical protein
MTLNALKHRNVAQVHRMLEGLIRFMAFLALLVSETAQVNWMLERAGLGILFHRPCRVINNWMANVAVVSNAFAVVANVLAIVTTEAPRRIKMTDVVGMRLPIRLHFWEEVSLKDALNLFRAGLYRIVLV